MKRALTLSAGWVFGLALLAGSCADVVGPVELTGADQAGKIVVNFGASTTKLPRDRYRVEQARIEGDTLRLSISHGGGCARHEYGLIAFNGWLESNPVQVQAMLVHDAHRDACDALLYATLRFDLKPLREAFVKAYGGPGGTVVINLDSLHFTYTF